MTAAADPVFYTGGTGHLVVATGRVLFTSDHALATTAWAHLQAGLPSDDLLDLILRNGIGAVPDLVLLDGAATGLRLLVRGHHDVQVEGSNGEREVVSAAEVTTWVERVLPTPRAVRLGSPSPDRALPLVCGVVLADGFLFSAAVTWSSAPAAAVGGASAAIARTGRAARSATADAVSTPVPAAAVPAVEVPAAPVPTGQVPAAPVSVPVPGPATTATRSLGETRAEPVESTFDHLFESTVMRSVEDAAVRDLPDSGAPKDPAGLVEIDAGDDAGSDRPGDHDGSTIMQADLAAARRSGSPAVAVPRSTGLAARLLLSTGEVIEVLDRAGIVIGRRPQADRVDGSALPQMVTVPSPNSDISRSHLRVEAVDGRITATDLRSTNGTVLTEVDGMATHLVAGQAREVVPGDELAIGDGVTVTVLEPA